MASRKSGRGREGGPSRKRSVRKRSRRKTSKKNRRGSQRKRRASRGNRATLRKLGKRRRKPSKRRYNRRLEFGLKHVRGGDTLEEAGAKIGRTAKQVRDYIVGTGVATERKGKLVFGKDR